MGKREITTTHARIIKEAERIVFDVVAEYCRKNRAECVTNGAFGTMLTRYSDRSKPGYFFYCGRWTKDLRHPKYLTDVIEWYEEMFGEIPQAICNDKGEWV